MPFNLLLLPLIGGFLLLHRSYYWRFHLARTDGHRLIFYAAFAGVVLLAGATVLAEVVARAVPASVDAWHRWVPFAHSGKAALALGLGYALPFLLNRVPGWDRNTRTRNAIEYFSDDLEMLLLRAMDNKTTLLLTMGSGKVYVGYVVQMFNPDVERRNIRVMPTMSGYRTRDQMRVVFTTYYSEVIDHAQDHESPFYDLLLKDFEIVLPVADLKSASLFDARAYEYFNREEDT